MLETKNMTCIVCPVGCSLEIALEEGRIHAIAGNKCPRGKEYATEEIVAPKRTLTTTVKVSGGKFPMASVKSATPIPKGMVIDCVNDLNQVVINAPVKVGQVVAKNILGTGVSIIATRNIESAHPVA